jgi:O-acetyl-ADP-ribose deacetylase (regulator of RNase III)
MVFLMITFTEGNLLDAKAEALVNTVNTVGVMGKGIALMFKEAFPENLRAYVEACKNKEIKVGSVFVTERHNWVGGPKWIVNFPTKQHWRNPSKIEWIKDGLQDLKRFIIENNVRSIALPPLGSGNGGLDWKDVRPVIEDALSTLSDVEVTVYEPTARYQNVAKPTGVEKLTAARALVAELLRRYSVLGFECTLLEIQKLAYLLQRRIVGLGGISPLKLEFRADKFGPYAPTLGHLLNNLDGSYLHCEKRISDAGILDTIWFEDSKKEVVSLFLKSTETKEFNAALDETTNLIEGFESPLGLELLSTIDWLLNHDKVEPTREGVKKGLQSWLGGGEASQRKLKLLEDEFIDLALSRLAEFPPKEGANASRS